MGWERGVYPRAIRHIRNANNLTVRVGITEARTHTHPDGNIDMAYLLSIHEEGRGNNPKRSTLVPAVQGYDFKADANALAKGLLTGGYRGAMQSTADGLAKEARRSMMRLKTPSLKPSTIANRVNGGSNPLVDTGQLVRAIDGVVD